MGKQLHPFTGWVCSIALAIGVVAADSAILAVITLGGVALLVYLRRENSPWSQSFTFSLKFGLILIFFRTLLGILIGVPIPGRVLFRVPILDLPDWMPGIRIGGAVTAERLTSSIHEGIIIATMIALFGAATTLTSPHKVLRVLPIFIYEVGVVLVIATSVFPQLIASAARIRRAQKLRGVNKPKLHRIAIPLLEEGLARALDLAAAMDARGFGVSKKRSRYRPIPWQKIDFSLVLLAIVAGSAMVAQ